MSGPAITVLLSIAAMAQALRVWQWRPGDPLDLSGDSTSLLASLKGILKHGTFGSNPDLGAPFHQDLSWFPHADHLHLFLSIKVIGLFSDNPFTVSAIYFFLGFPLAALSMYWLARQRHLSRLGSVVAGVLFSVVPGHQSIFQHLWLASYWVVPLGMWLVVRAALGEPLFRVKVDWRDPVRSRSDLRLNVTTVFCVLCIAFGGIYYSAFTLLLLAVTLLLRRVATGDSGSLARTSAVPASIGLLSLAALLSVSFGQDKSTLVSTPLHRSILESEKYAGKLMDLVLPWTHHRVDPLRYVTVKYNSLTTATFEQPALGVTALAGVVALMVIMLSSLFRQRVKPAHSELGMLGVLTVIAISFFSIGGLGSVVALFLTPQIRTWSRLFVVIALFGLLAVGHWVTVVSRRHRVLGRLAAGALLVIGVLDQTNPAMAPNYAYLRSQVADLTSFSRSIQARVGPGCSVFQLPVVPFPEGPHVHALGNYEHFGPYLGSSSLRWSFGAFRGTSLADWQLALPQRSTAQLVNDVVAAGFCGLEVDRKGFADLAAALETDLRRLLGAPISTTHDDRLLAWDLAPARAALTSYVGAEHMRTAGDLVLHPLIVYTDQGTFGVEHDKRGPYQWTRPSAEIDVHNFGRTAIDKVRLTFSLAAPDSAPRTWTVHLPDARTQEVTARGGNPQEVQLLLKATSGRNTVVITTTGEGRNVNGNTVFSKLINVQAHVSDPMTHLAVIQQRTD